MEVGALAQGALAGLKVVEFAGMGPGPLAAMMLADHGAEVLRIDRPGTAVVDDNPVTSRGRASLALDLKQDKARALCLSLFAKADVVIEGFRPGVMERLGLGPDAALAENPRLVYGRITGWGQDGPLARTAGHDISYIAVTGALHGIREPDRPPTPPLNLIGDYAGGTMFLLFGILAALHEAQRSGQGQVVDAAMIDGAAALMAPWCGWTATGTFDIARERNVLGGAAPFYRCYACADGEWVAVGALEPQFYQALLEGLELDPAALPQQYATQDWPELHRRLEAAFLTRPAAEWVARFDGGDACVAPVLPLSDAARHPQMASRGVYQWRDGLMQPSPAPRLSRTPGVLPEPAPAHGAGGERRLADWGVYVD